MIHFFVRHRAPMLLVLFCIVVFGASSYGSLPRESNPDVKIPYITVTTPYPGVSPRDIETLVTIPIEGELAGLSDVKSLNSSSAEGLSAVSIEFEPETVIEDAMQRVRDRVSRARASLPQDAEETDVREISFAEFPIMLVNLAGSVDETELKRHAEALQDDIERVSGVLDVRLAGGRTREFRVQANPHRLAHYNLGLSDLINAIGSENVNVPGGEVAATSANFLVRIPGQFTSAREIETVALPRRGDRPVFVRDVATVIDSFKDRSTYSRMNGEPSVSLSVIKRSGANIVAVASEAKRIVAEHAETWPGSVRHRVLADMSRDVDIMVSELENGILLALLLVVGVTLFFMGVRNSLFVALAIPLSMLAGMMVFSLLDVTLNMVVLFSLVLVLGMLVDNAIVLVENIYRHLEMGKSPFDASVQGAREVAGAVIASTLTTVAAFAPLLFWTGIMGQFMVYLPITVVTVLSTSLFVAIVLLPVLTSIGLRAKPKSKLAEQRKPSAVLQLYSVVLRFCLRYRLSTTLLAVAVLVATFAVYGAKNHGTVFFPEVEPDRATVTIEAADGTDVEETDRIVREVEQVLIQEEALETYVADTGVAMGDFSASEATNQARITLNFYPHASKTLSGEVARSENSNVTLERIRRNVSGIIGANIKVEKEANGPPVGKPISVEITSRDFHAAGAYAATLRRQLAEIDGVTGLADNYHVGRPELRFRVDRGAAKRVGASTGEIANSVRAAINGTKASSFRDGEDEYDITVELAPEFRNDLQSVLALRIPGREDTEPGTFSVPISTVATYQLSGGTGSISHKAQEPMVTVSGDIKEGFNDNAVRSAVTDFIDSVKAPDGIHVRLGGANDEQKKAEAFMSRAFGIAVFLIALVLVAQFNSFVLPIIILFAVVLSLIGVLWGLLLTATPFGIIMTGLGVISLAGVVVNNAIVLLDYVESLRREGVPRDEALIEAGKTRFRPVMLTATTTILGLVPMAIGLSIDFKAMEVFWGTQSAEMWGPMAVAVVFGLAFATVLTLVVVPAIYVLFDDIGGLKSRVTDWLLPRRRRRRAQTELASAE